MKELQVFKNKEFGQGGQIYFINKFKEKYKTREVAK